MCCVIVFIIYLLFLRLRRLLRLLRLRLRLLLRLPLLFLSIWWQFGGGNCPVGANDDSGPDSRLQNEGIMNFTAIAYRNIYRIRAHRLIVTFPCKNISKRA